MGETGSRLADSGYCVHKGRGYSVHQRPGGEQIFVLMESADRRGGPKGPSSCCPPAVGFLAFGFLLRFQLVLCATGRPPFRRAKSGQHPSSSWQEAKRDGKGLPLRANFSG